MSNYGPGALEIRPVAKSMSEVKHCGEVIGYIHAFEGDFDWFPIVGTQCVSKPITYKSLKECVQAIQEQVS